MNISLVLKNESFNHIENKNHDDLYELLIDLQETKDNIKISGEKTFRNDEIYNEEIKKGIEIYKIVFMEDLDGISVEEAKLLSKIINHTTPMDDITYNDLSGNIGNRSNPFGFLCCFLNDDTPLHINNPTQISSIRKHYLHFITEPSKFIQSCKICFPNLAFHESVAQSLNSLSTPLNNYSREIIRHLEAINDIFHPLYKETKHDGMVEILKILKAQAPLECSLEGDAKSARKRFLFEFINDSGEIEELVCEPHTKLEGTGNPGDTEYRTDRIYFHGGRENIESGKTLIAHIGCHL
ncbi:hypothetical protein AJ85_01945 [Alkalihalobacillus alcalophilus ATCC 27647 = CGMCC 1.3604]|uniref:Uncharacterized protein n=1 Tax=Alkalihalobacillus alcalophilus ATCC 27647 = CGMCC 1.3604 TaxID=1218173 RepID=A0A094WNF8_ALKAL|nr:hypothetical protein [Alkalihalobacillus alcalophilus]KGA97508.1 hypothetical protein BALCAV_0209630 [Alkalihalobacillus alcalophilus ATCC 27647 = CGMCC 1.3604]MED1560760.1 hypothetical protein [Alkalihalobacillus alcalophilus]THG91772.1 hypothetical protein AJ85_01945 [Alkalihalobacillus alcalophilus ATCC 27647 = CGMCC 1.3604]